jgi:hypothetical protein
MTLHGLVVFYISCTTYFVHKFLYCFTCVISLGIYVGRVPGFIVHWNQKYLQPTLLLRLLVALQQQIRYNLMFFWLSIIV